MEIKGTVKLFFTMLLLLFNLVFFAQDLTNITEKKKFQVTGGVNTNSTFYSVSGKDANRDPFGWQLNANLNFRLFETWDIPFSVNLSKNNYAFNQPAFNVVGLSPKYKAITIHLGFRSMQFSSYSLSGLTFYGVGIEINPKEALVKCSGMYGRFSPAIKFGETKDGIPLIPAYERWGTGAKISLGKTKNNFDFIFFKAKDLPGSLDSIPKGSDLAPAENVVVGISSGLKPFLNLSLSMEYTISTFTSNINQEETEYSTYTYANNFGFLITPRLSTSIYNAFSYRINYKIGFIGFGLSYKRVDPGYRSLGATYLANDLEDYLLNATLSLLDNKMNIAASAGKQRNNLDDNSLNTTSRFVGSFNVNYTMSSKLNFTANYSNFNSNSTVSGFQFTDSVKYFQAMNNAGITSNYNFGNDQVKQSLMLVYNYQIANTLNYLLTEVVESGTLLNTVNLSHNLSFTASKMSISTSFSMNHFKSQGSVNQSFGPTISINKRLLNEKLPINMAYSLLLSQNENAGSMVNLFRLGTGFKYGKHHSLRINSNVSMRRIKSNETNEKVKESRANITYSYNF